MKNLLFHLKAVKTGTLKAQVGAGAGAESNSFGSATLPGNPKVTDLSGPGHSLQ
jgi:hypothetical protein